MATGHGIGGDIHATRVLRNPDAHVLTRDKARGRSPGRVAGKYQTVSTLTPAQAEKLYEELRDRYCEAYQVSPSLLRGNKRVAIAAHDIRKLICHDMHALGATLNVIGYGIGINHTNVLRALQKPRAEAEARLLSRLQGMERQSAEAYAKRTAEWLRENAQPVVAERTLRGLWNASVQAYFAAHEDNRAVLWRELCKAMFENSWRHQAAVPPRVPA